MNAKDTARRFKALSEPPRIAILHILAAHPDTLTVDKLIEKLHAAGFPAEALCPFMAEVEVAV